MLFRYVQLGLQIFIVALFPSLGHASSSGAAEAIGSLRIQEFAGGQIWLLISPYDESFFSAERISVEGQHCVESREAPFVVMNTTAPAFDYQYGLLLAALTTGAKVTFTYGGCFQFYGWHPIVNMVELNAPRSGS